MSEITCLSWGNEISETLRALSLLWTTYFQEGRCKNIWLIPRNMDFAVYIIPQVMQPLFRHIRGPRPTRLCLTKALGHFVNFCIVGDHKSFKIKNELVMGKNQCCLTLHLVRSALHLENILRVSATSKDITLVIVVYYPLSVTGHDRVRSHCQGEERSYCRYLSQRCVNVPTHIPLKRRYTLLMFIPYLPNLGRLWSQTRKSFKPATHSSFWSSVYALSILQYGTFLSTMSQFDP